MASAEIIVLGGRGFLESASATKYRHQGIEPEVVDADEYSLRAGAKCRVLINTTGNSRKYLADQNPQLEFEASVRGVARALHDFRFEHYMQLSALDVHSNKMHPEHNSESSPIRPMMLSRYGHHQWLAEDPQQTSAGLMESRRAYGIRIQDNNRRFSERMFFTSEDTP